MFHILLYSHTIIFLVYSYPVPIQWFYLFILPCSIFSLHFFSFPIFWGHFFYLFFHFVFSFLPDSAFFLYHFSFFILLSYILLAFLLQCLFSFLPSSSFCISSFFSLIQLWKFFSLLLSVQYFLHFFCLSFPMHISVPTVFYPLRLVIMQFESIYHVSLFSLPSFLPDIIGFSYLLTRHFFCFLLNFVVSFPWHLPSSWILFTVAASRLVQHPAGITYKVEFKG